MSKVLYTIGYGNSKPEDFMARLKKAGVTVVLDVRRDGASSWCNSYHQGHQMRLLLYPDIKYLASSSLGNKYDTLDAYKKWINTGGWVEIESREGIFDDYAGETICLLCAERDAHKDGEVNCHRVYVADALVKLLGDEWEVKDI